MNNGNTFKKALRGVLEEHVIEWKVNDFLSMLSQPGCEIRSPFTASAVKDDCHFYFKLQPVQGGEKIGLFTLYFLTRCFRDVELEVNCDCEVLTRGHCVVAGGLQISGKSPQRPINCNFRIDYRDEDSLAYRILEDDCLVIRARFGVWHGTPDGEGGPASVGPRRAWHGGALQADLYRSSSVKLPTRAGPVYNQEARRSASIHLQEPRRPASLNVPTSKRPASLHLPSPCSEIIPPKDFASKTESAHSPGRADETILTDILKMNISSSSSSIVSHLLTYIATGDIPNLDNYAEEILPIAHKYTMIDLKRKCCASLWKNISDDNAVYIYNIAERYACEQLKKRVLNYISVDPEKRLGSSRKENLPSELKKIKSKSDARKGNDWY